MWLVAEKDVIFAIFYWFPQIFRNIVICYKNLLSKFLSISRNLQPIYESLQIFKFVVYRWNLNFS